MIVLLKENPNASQLENLMNWLKSFDIEVHVSKGIHQTILGLIGDTSLLDIDLLKALDIVEDVKRIQEPYKNANRKFHPTGHHCRRPRGQNWRRQFSDHRRPLFGRI